MSNKSYLLLFKFKWSIFTVFLLSTEPSAASMHHVGHKFHEVFQLKQGRFSDLSAAKISEMMKSNSLDVSFHLCNLNGHPCYLMLEFSLWCFLSEPLLMTFQHLVCRIHQLSHFWVLWTEYWMKALKERVTKYHMYVIGGYIRITSCIEYVSVSMYLCNCNLYVRACIHTLLPFLLLHSVWPVCWEKLYKRLNDVYQLKQST